MAQIPLHEYDVKKMFARYSGTEYQGIQIRDTNDTDKLDTEKKYIIKPDMLFGKRGKRGMLGINLSPKEVQNWLSEWYKKEVDIDGVRGSLEVFLAEEMIDIKREYYLAFEQTRDGERIYFSENGGVDIEENWESISEISVNFFTENIGDSLKNMGLSPDNPLAETLLSLFNFYRTHGFTSLEFNPLALDTSGNLHLIDAVGKVDDCEHFLQKNNWGDIEFPHSFGFRESKAERYIRELDTQTGASLKLKILNPDAAIWTLFAGGGGSLVMTDTLGALGYSSEIGNYGELSGNPSREFTREYIKTLLAEILKSQSKKQKYLIIAGAIANFTDIANTFQGVIDVLEAYQDEIQKQNIKILVRRGGINEEKGLNLLRDACKKLEIPALIHGSDKYMTEILQEIIL